MTMDRQQAKDYFRTQTDGAANILVAHEAVWDAFVDFVYDRPGVGLVPVPAFEEPVEGPTQIGCVIVSIRPKREGS